MSNVIDTDAQWLDFQLQGNKFSVSKRKISAFLCIEELVLVGFTVAFFRCKNLYCVERRENQTTINYLVQLVDEKRKTSHLSKRIYITSLRSPGQADFDQFGYLKFSYANIFYLGSLLLIQRIFVNFLGSSIIIITFIFSGKLCLYFTPVALYSTQVEFFNV